MAVFRNDGWETNRAVYAEVQVEATLNELGIPIVTETETVFLASCPFHNNPGSPAFAVNKESGLYYCHNPACAEKGTLTQLVQKVNEVNYHEAKRLIHRHHSSIDYVALAEREAKPVEFEPFDQVLLDRLRNDFAGSPGEEYMLGRGFNEDTLNYFEIGYSQNRRCVIVPMHSDTGLPIGFIARSITGKVFLNSKGLPKSQTAWNMHRAKKTGATGIIVESSFDAMRIHQAGYPNTIALLGGSLSRLQKDQIEKYFSTVVIATDNDFAGRALGEKIEDKLRRKVLWAASGPEVYPHGAKDMGDLTDQEIRQLLTHAVSGFEYHLWAD